MSLLNAPHQILVISGNFLPGDGYLGDLFFKTSEPGIGWYFCGLNNQWTYWGASSYGSQGPPGTPVFIPVEVGEEGPTGSPGPQGNMGMDGALGPAGQMALIFSADGEDGIQGPPGPPGALAPAAQVTFVFSADGEDGAQGPPAPPRTEIGGLPIYANNAAALAGGLVVGSLYRTGADPDPVCVVH